MNRELTEYKEKMGDDLGEIYYYLHYDLYMISLHFSQYKDLYTSKKRVEILNNSASELFYIIQSIFWDRIILDIAKITDKEVDRFGNENISVKLLNKYVSDSDLKKAISYLICEVEKITKTITNKRNKILAHSDYDYRKQTKIVNREEIETIEEVIRLLTNILHSICYFFSVTPFSYHIIVAGGAEKLLYMLRDGLKLDEIRDKQLEDGNFESDSWYENEL